MNGITSEEAAGRIVRAMRLDCVMRDDERSALRVKIPWPAYTYDRADRNSQAENYSWLRQIEADAARRRSWDTMAARTDYLEVMSWICEVDRLTGVTLSPSEIDAVLALRRQGVAYRTIARRLALSPRAVGLVLEIQREIDRDALRLSNAEFCRRIALDWDMESIGRADHTDPDQARRRWADLTMLAADVASGRIGRLRSTAIAA